MPSEEEDNSSDEETLRARQRAEKKQLKAKVLKLKKDAGKDKKKKKAIQDEISSLEKALEDRHKAELAELKKTSLTLNEPEGIESLKIDDKPEEKDSVECCMESNEGTNNEKGKRKVTRAEKRRQKEANADRERERMIKEDMKASRFSARNVEAEKIKSHLKKRALKMHEISPDGNCLYAAVAHQLGTGISVFDLRSKAADFIRLHADDFLPFLTDLSTGDLLSPVQFEEYCTLLQTTPAWGGQPELRALSQTLKRRIEVLQAEGSPIVFGDEFTMDDTLLLVYYRHYYGLGEHYNSVVPLSSQRGSQEHKDESGNQEDNDGRP